MKDIEILQNIFNTYEELPNWDLDAPPLHHEEDHWGPGPTFHLENGKLTGLGFSGFNIEGIPKEIFKFTELKTLVFSNLNYISEIPQSISNLKKIERFAIDQMNKLKSIPTEIGELKNLEELYIKGTKLKSIPLQLGNLKNLISLSLNENGLNFLPQELVNLKNLKIFKIHGNEFHLPDKVHESSPQEQIRYILNLQAQGAVPLNEGKIIMLGDGTAGKTALIERLLFNTFSGTTEMTEGIEIQNWNIDDVKLNIWDFGGQEIMRAMHQFFMTPRTLYILTCTHRTDESDKQVEDWLRLIKAFGGDSPVIIVKSKSDIHELNLDENRLKDLYPNIQEIINTSAKENIGIKELKYSIKKILNHEVLKHIKSLIPKNQVMVKEEILETQKSENYIDLNRYYLICERNNVSDNIEQLDLLRLLQDLGIAFNYGNKENPANTTVLKPEWVTKGIYAIINNNELFQQEGNVYLDDLKNILLPKVDYQGKYNVIMGLMTQFELCFAVNERLYLVPDLLPKKQPYLGNQFENSLQLQYQYELLPRSIMPQFICRTNKIAKHFWLHGVIINNGSNDGLVQVNYDKNKIFIHVNGDIKSRRILLDEIRENFTILNDKIKGDNPEVLVPLPNNPKITVSYDLLIQAERANDTHVRVKDAGMIQVKPLLDSVTNEKERANLETFSEKLKEHHSDIKSDLKQTESSIVNQLDQKEIAVKNKIVAEIEYLNSKISKDEILIKKYEYEAKEYAQSRLYRYFGFLFILTIPFTIIIVKYWGQWGEPVSWAILFILGLILYISRNWIAPWSVYERDLNNRKEILMNSDGFDYRQHLIDIKKLDRLQ